MTVYKTQQTVGIKEDLKDIIWNISPEETPFLSGMAKTNATQTLHEWQTDELAPPTDDNAAVEGGNAATGSYNPTKRLGNRTQIFTKTARVSGTNESADAAGRSSEMAYQLDKKSKEMKRDAEMTIFSSRNALAGDGVNVASRLGGAFGELVGGEDTINFELDLTDNADGLTAAALEQTIQAIYLNGASPDTFFYHASKASSVANFGISANEKQKFSGASETTFTNMVSIYVDPLGHNIRCLPSRFMQQPTGLVTRMDVWECCELRPAFKQELAKTGDFESQQLLHEFTLVHKNQDASGKIVGIDETTP